MAHLSASPPATANSSWPISTRTLKKVSLLSAVRVPKPAARHGEASSQFHHRRTFLYGLIGAGLGSAMCGDDAKAAARRPPPPPPTEKKDPNVSGVQAKVLASIKRKEAMKEATAKLRERGKPINEPPK